MCKIFGIGPYEFLLSEDKVMAREVDPKTRRVIKQFDVDIDTIYELSSQNNVMVKLSPEELNLVQGFRKASRKEKALIHSILDDYGKEDDKP